ncbi:MAG: hypothetical protein ABSG25_01230 [Bryobacteraceae bacterium]
MQPITGVAGNFLLASAEQPPGQSQYLSVVCFGAVTLIQTNDSIEWRQGTTVRSWPAPAGAAVLGYSRSGAYAFACFAASGMCAQIDANGNLTEVAGWNEPSSQTLGIASQSPGQVSLLVRQDDTLALVSLDGGGVTARTELEGIGSPALLAPDGTLVYTEGSNPMRVLHNNRLSAPGVERSRSRNQILIRNIWDSQPCPQRSAGGCQPKQIELPAPATALALLGRGWVSIALANGRRLALQPASSQPILYELPEVTQ